jgi:hypothetical protein
MGVFLQRLSRRSGGLEGAVPRVVLRGRASVQHVTVVHVIADHLRLCWLGLPILLPEINTEREWIRQRVLQACGSRRSENQPEMELRLNLGFLS